MEPGHHKSVCNRPMLPGPGKTGARNLVMHALNVPRETQFVSGQIKVQ